MSKKTKPKKEAVLFHMNPGKTADEKLAAKLESKIERREGIAKWLKIGKPRKKKYTPRVEGALKCPKCEENAELDIKWHEDGSPDFNWMCKKCKVFLRMNWWRQVFTVPMTKKGAKCKEETSKLERTGTPKKEN